MNKSVICRHAVLSSVRLEAKRIQFSLRKEYKVRNLKDKPQINGNPLRVPGPWASLAWPRPPVGKVKGREGLFPAGGWMNTWQKGLQQEFWCACRQTPTYEPSSWELSQMQTCECKLVNHENESTCLTALSLSPRCNLVFCVPHCAVLYREQQFYLKLSMSRSKRRSCGNVAVLQFSRCCIVRFKKYIYFIFCICLFLCLICVKSSISLLQCSTRQQIALFGCLS